MRVYGAAEAGIRRRTAATACPAVPTQRQTARPFGVENVAKVEMWWEGTNAAGKQVRVEQARHKHAACMPHRQPQKETVTNHAAGLHTRAGKPEAAGGSAYNEGSRERPGTPLSSTTVTTAGVHRATQPRVYGVVGRMGRHRRSRARCPRPQRRTAARARHPQR